MKNELICINELFSEQDCIDIDMVLRSCVKLSNKISRKFYGIISGKCLTMNDFDKIVEYKYSATDNEKLLLIVVEKIHDYLFSINGNEWEDGDEYGTEINGHVYKLGDYVGLGYRMLKENVNDNKIQFAEVVK